MRSKVDHPMRRVPFGVVAVLLAVASVPSTSFAADAMVGVHPADGGAAFGKVFWPSVGSCILAVRFTSNDPTTVFPEVSLYRGPLTKHGEGTLVAATNNAPTDGAGQVMVSFGAGIEVTEPEPFYVFVRPPAGSRKQAPGRGAAIGASTPAGPSRSFLSPGPDEALIPVTVEFEIELTTAASKAAARSPEDGTEPHAAQQQLVVSSPLRVEGASITFDMAHAGQVSMRIFDVAGRLVKTVAEGHAATGRNVRSWDGSDETGQRVATGVYFLVARLGDSVEERKILMLR